jgi:hypothetical protein
MFFQRPLLAVWIILEISFLTSGRSDNLGGVNSTLAYLIKVFKLGLAVLIIAKYNDDISNIIICIVNIYEHFKQKNLYLQLIRPTFFVTAPLILTIYKFRIYESRTRITVGN